MDHEQPAMQVTEKPWGREVLVACTERYALKDIFLRAGTRSSLQSHVRKHETILVIEGRIRLERGGPEGPLSEEIVETGGAYIVTPGTRHRVTALEDTRLIEASTPELDDLIRHADDYGRQ